MVLSSDKVSGLRKPLLMLKVQTMSADNSVASNLVEMDASELAKFLKTLKAAQKVRTLKLDYILMMCLNCSQNDVFL